MPENYQLGMDAVMYWGSAAAELAAMTELDNVRDVTVNLEAGEADVTTRANSGWRATAATLRECSVDFEMVWKPGDPAFEALKDAYLAGTLIELAVLDQDRETAGAQGPKGSFAITSFSRNEALEEGITVSVTAKLSAFDEWVEVGT